MEYFPMKKHSFLLSAVLLFSLLISSHLYSGVEKKVPTFLKDIEFMVVTPEHEQITFQFDSSVTAKIFSFKGEKTRIIIDLPETVPVMAIANNIKTDGNLVERIRMGIHKGDKARTRIVLDISSDMEVSCQRTVVDKENNLLRLSVYKAGNEPVPPKPLQPMLDSQDKKIKGEKEGPEKPKSTGNDITADAPASDLPPDPFRVPEIEAKETSEPAVKSVEPVTVAPPVEMEAPATPVLLSIIFGISTGKEEMVRFQLSGFYPPEISVIEAEVPRIICDFKSTTPANSIANIMEPDSQFIKSIRVGEHDNPDKIRVVIDLVPGNNYDLKQVFFKEKNSFVIIINAINK
jgi:hypothetical protein